MAEPYLAEIRMTSATFAPTGWALCNGQLLPTNQNQALFSLLGTTYGGNGTTTFALPDLRGRIPMHEGGDDLVLGQRGGEATHALTQAELPAHRHSVSTAAAANAVSPAGNVLAAPGKPAFASQSTANVSMNAAATAPSGGNQAHENRPPYLAVNFMIATQGIFPSQN